MIVCKLMGGLGNQMFQYAYALALAKKLKDEICFDNDFYKGENPTLFKLQIVQKNIVKEKELPDLKAAKRAEKVYHIIQFIIRKINHEKIGIGLFQKLSSRGYYFNFDPFYYPSVVCDRNNKYIYGYFQGIQYFEPIEEEIRKQFTSKIGDVARKYASTIKKCNAVAVHIRLGDYHKRKNQYLNVCTDIYYTRGINYIRNHVEKPVFFVFTNDSDSIKKKSYIPDDAIIVEGTKDYEDLMLMKSCKHFVISGSTFSWWGSFLSENTSKITVAPKNWMTTLRAEPAITKRLDLVRIETD